MNRTLTLALFAASVQTLAACGTRHTESVAAPQEPNVVVFDGNYEVSLSSDDPNCVAEDANWSVTGTAANTYLVDTDTDVSYVQSNRALQIGNGLAWSERRTYSNAGCDSAVTTRYQVSMDADGNITGTATQQSSGGVDCGGGDFVCTYQVSSVRRQ